MLEHYFGELISGDWHQQLFVLLKMILPQSTPDTRSNNLSLQ
jgi:hypothetical protein